MIHMPEPRQRPGLQKSTAEKISTTLGKTFTIILNADAHSSKEWRSVFSSDDFMPKGCDVFPKRDDYGNEVKMQVFWFSPVSEGSFSIRMEHVADGKQPTEVKTFEVMVSRPQEASS